MTEEERIALDVKTTARRLGIGRNLCYEQIAQGIIPHFRMGSRILVPVAALEQMIREASK